MPEVTPPVPSKVNPWVEAAKEVARLLVFALPGILLQVASAHPNLTTSGVGVLVLMGLRAADKAIHDNPNNSSNGLLPF